jgi:AAA15 family ATPase/GTPase
MIIKFTVGNFLSFKDKVSISFAVKKGCKGHLEAVFETKIKGEGKFIKTAAIYGANASGKSNLIKAIKFFKYFLTEFHPTGEGEIKIPFATEFLLSDQTREKPSFFEAEILFDGEVYVYGFEVSKKEIHAEWLKRKKGKKVFFERKKQKIEPARDFQKEASKDVIARTREDFLFLSKLAENNVDLARQIKAEVLKIVILSGMTEEMQRFAISSYVDNSEFKKKMNEFMLEADFGIRRIEAKYGYLPAEEVFKNAPNEIKDLLQKAKLNQAFQHQISSVHNKFDKDGKKTGEELFNFLAMESEGTKRMFFISAQFAKILIEGGMLIIDEIDSALHPILCKFILKKFNSKADNKKNAQLIFTTHDISFLHEDFLRKDQIWFVEKNKFEASEVFSLCDLGERDGVSYSKRYLEGRYGAIPYVKYLEGAE